MYRLMTTDADHRDVDFGEDIGGHAEGGEDAQDDDHHGHDDEGVGAAESETDYPHGRWPGGLVDSLIRFWVWSRSRGPRGYFFVRAKPIKLFI